MGPVRKTLVLRWWLLLLRNELSCLLEKLSIDPRVAFVDKRTCSGSACLGV